jgi:hypothetical protein
MERAKNEATSKDVEKCLRGNNVSLVLLNKFNAAETEVASVKLLEGFLSDLFDKTLRPTKSILLTAIMKEYSPDVTSLEGSSYVRKILDVITYCRSKGSRMNTGIKLDASVRTLAKKLAGTEFVKRASSASFHTVGNCTTPMKKKTRLAIMDKPVEVNKESILSMYGSVYEVKDEDEKSAEEIISSQEVHSLPSTPVRRLSTKTSPLRIRVGLDVQGYINAGEHCMQRVRGGRLEKATMTRGSNGFLVAQYEFEESFETEIANLLTPVMTIASKKKEAAPKTKNAKGAQKKPAAERASKAVASDSAGDAAGRTYSKMYYKKCNNFGIRRKGMDKKQICTVSVRGATKEFLVEIADELILALEDGLAENEWKTWLAKKLAADDIE